jgi:uncharacterized membrane protein YqjE
MAGSSPTGRGGDDSLIETLQALLHELPGLVSDRVELFTLELERAGAALARIVAWVVAIAIVGVTAWLTLWAGLVVALVVDLGLHWAIALLPVLAINLIAVAVGLKQVRQLATRLALPATRRHLTMSRPARTAASAAAAEPAPDPTPVPTSTREPLHAGAEPAPPPAA